MGVGLFHSLEVDAHVWDKPTAFGCNEQTLRGCAGGFLYPAIRDLRRDVLQGPAAHQHDFYLERNTYRARTLVGWSLLEGILGVFAPVAIFRLLRLRLNSWVSGLVTAALMLLALVLLFVASFPSD